MMFFILYLGSSLGTLVMSPAVTILLEKIHFRSFVLVMSAVNLSLFFVGCLMKPQRENKNASNSTKKSADEVNEGLNNNYVTFNKENVTHESFEVSKENATNNRDEFMKELPIDKSAETIKRLLDCFY